MFSIKIVNPIQRRFLSLNQFQCSKSIKTSSHLFSKRKVLDDTDPQTEEIRKSLSDLPEKQYHREYIQEEFGWVYDKKPFKYNCKEGKVYLWCCCGRSHSQPFCDGTHKVQHFKIKLRPVRWECKETKEYWFCNCKQTKNRPFCDGTHKLSAVQQRDSTIKEKATQTITSDKDVKKLIKSIREKGFQDDW